MGKEKYLIIAGIIALAIYLWKRSTYGKKKLPPGGGEVSIPESPKPIRETPIKPVQQEQGSFITFKIKTPKYVTVEVISSRLIPPEQVPP